MAKSTNNAFSIAIKIILALVVLVLTVLVFQWLVATKPEAPLQPRHEVVRNVSASTIELTDVRPTHRAFGTVVATRVSGLHFPIGGEVNIISPKMQSGGFVEEGEFLAGLDTEILLLNLKDIQSRLKTTQQSHKELQERLTLHERQYDRVRNLNSASVASERRLDDALLSLSNARSALIQNNAQLEQLQIELKRVERNLRDATLKAPFSGVLSRVSIGRGQILNSAHSLGIITDLNSLEVSFIVPAETYIDATEMIGEEVKITWRVGGRSIVVEAGEIVRAEHQVDTGKGGGLFYARFAKSGALRSIPVGAFVEVSYASSLLENVAILPDQALFDQNRIFLIKDDRAIARDILLLDKRDGFIFVKGDFSPGDQVVATRLPGLGDGALVKVIKP